MERKKAGREGKKKKKGRREKGEAGKESEDRLQLKSTRKVWEADVTFYVKLSMLYYFYLFL